MLAMLVVLKYLVQCLRRNHLTWSMLDRYIHEHVVPIIKLNHGIKEFTHGYQNGNTNHQLMSIGYVKVRESLYARNFIWIRYHSEPNWLENNFCLDLKVLAWYIGLNARTLLISKNMCNPHYRYTRGFSKKTTTC